jgi:heavy metal efflux system protein
MIEKIVRLALQQRVLIAVIAIVMLFVGLMAVKKLSVDAFPDVTNVQVQVATEAPGRSPEEVERFVTVPIEITMTGLPGLVEMRSLNRNGLSIVTLVFTEKTDIYFARQLVMERLLEVMTKMPVGVLQSWLHPPQDLVRFINTPSSTPAMAIKKLALMS